MKNRVLYILTIIVLAYFITFVSVGVPSWIHKLMLGLSFTFTAWSIVDYRKGKEND